MILTGIAWVALAFLLLAAVMLFVMLLQKQWAAGPFALSPEFRSMPEADYANFWAAGDLARHGQIATIYSPHGFEAVRQHLFGQRFVRLDWVYPPSVFLLAVPFSFIPLLPGYVLWLTLVFAASAAVLRYAGLSWPVTLLGLCSPAAWRAFQLGQIVPLTGSLVFAGILLSRSRPIQSGFMLGIATLKPQIGFLAPAALLAAGRWRAILAGGCVFIGLIGVSVLCFGFHSWLLFLDQGGAAARSLLETFFRRGYPSLAGSVFWTARAWGASLHEAYAIQAVAAVCGVVGIVIFCRRYTEDTAACAMITCCLSLLASPYLYADDFIAYSLSVALFAERRGKLELLPVLLWIWPGLSDAATSLGGRPILPFCVLLTVLLVWRNSRASGASC